MARRERPEGGGRLKQIATAFQMTRRVDNRLVPILLGVGIGVFAVLLALGFVLGHPIYLGVLGLLLGLLATVIVFGRRAERAAFAQVEGEPGAAAAVLNTMRRGWTVTPGVQVTRNQDAVHRAVGPAGIVLVGEGAPSRVPNLLAAEKRRMARVAGETPIFDVVAGNGPDQVPLRKLQRHLMRLPRALKPAQVRELNDRLRAMGSLAQNLPIPKGPLPKGVRMPRGGKVR